MRSRPTTSTSCSPLDTSVARCRLVVGQLHSNRFAISPALQVPRSCTESRICRRAGCANAAKTLSAISTSLMPFGLDTHHVDVRKFHVRFVAALLAQMVHRFPDGHHFGVFVRAIHRTVAPVENLEVNRLAVVLFFTFEMLRPVVGDESQLMQRRPMSFQQGLELLFVTACDPIVAD